MSLEMDQNLWCVTYESLDDGYRITRSYHTNKDVANKKSQNENKGAVVQICLWKDPNTGLYYKIEAVDIDMPDKSEVLKKLSLKERKILGY